MSGYKFVIRNEKLRKHQTREMEGSNLLLRKILNLDQLNSYNEN